eukprot:CAMPEP_0194085526 /NCGR_PEP_ID=MMETSP0149-20130528/17743_1 /TAXON_ID=122233 /ORGANISM="Chaetoceros debilis, Strain MM31A-1" /LENGTH=1623 /DNA_ID=CAMNT_0038768423 /DNA_START=348 /DNA_END=5219 /DNA_ORIENTATION=+
MTVPQQITYQNQAQQQQLPQQIQPQVSSAVSAAAPRQTQVQGQVTTVQQVQSQAPPSQAQAPVAPQQQVAAAPQQAQQQMQQPQVAVSQQQAPQQQVPQVQHQQHMPPQGLNGGWQSEGDIVDRRKMIAKIVQLLQARKPNAPQDWLNKLPQMAKRLEETLYRTAPTFAAYNDANTLKQRLQQLAMRMKQRPVPRQAQQHSQQHTAMKAQTAAVPGQQAVAVAQASQQKAVAQPQRSTLVNMSDINPGLMQQAAAPVATAQVTPTPGTYQQQQPQGATAIKSQPVMNGATHAVAAPVGTAMPIASSTTTAAVAPQPAVSQQQAAASSVAAAAAGGSRSNSDRAQVLRHQQQRLLLLRHAAKCPHEDGRCPVTPHCAGMKRLWKHIAECKNQKCQVPHCVSSRYVLSHYHRCKDVRCPVCGPVREAIHRSHEKQKQMSAQEKEKQNKASLDQLRIHHQQELQQQKVQNPGPAIVPSQAQSQAQTTQKQAVIMPDAKKRKVSHNTAPQSDPAVPPVIPSSQGPMKPGRTGYVIVGGESKSSGPKKTQEDLTLINSLTINQIEQHIKSLNRGLQLPPAKLKSRCGEVLKILQQHPHGWVFNSPVDPVELGLPDYFEVVKRPMDLGSIKKRLENGCYHLLEDFHIDVNLTFENAMLYNPEGSVVYNMAKEMKEKFAQDYDNLILKLKAEEDEKRTKGDACALCGSEKLLFEPPVFYCNGLKCSSQRIRRNSYYYVGGNNKYHWCHQCYGDLKDNQEIQMPDATFKKQDLTKKKNDEVREESWVHCDRCNRWIHQICGLFNTRKNQDQGSEYVCPRCTMEDRKKRGAINPTTTTPMAEDLQRTKLSEFLENHIRDKMESYIDDISKEKADREKIPLEQAKKHFELGGPITIRQVASMDRKLEVREKMKSRYGFKNYPEEFNFRCKCIIVFQNLDGVDVILFGLYVYEHDHNNPAPNKRSVYLSYLDSVHYMRPRTMRTHIYHEILVAYLDYVRKRGFSTVHIWACPPGKGDDYILYAKPEEQKTPRDDRLRLWYYKMLVKAQERGIVGKVTNMYDLYFTNPKNDATIIPYMEGDYFPGEVENTIRDMEEGKHSKKANSEGKKKKSKSKKNKAGRKGTRSGGIDEDALAASGILPPGYDQKSMEQGHQDYVMKKVGQVIEPMKESFIVAYLSWAGARAEDMVVPKEIMEAREKMAGGRDGKQSKAKSEESKLKNEQSSLVRNQGIKVEDTDGKVHKDVKMEDVSGTNKDRNGLDDKSFKSDATKSLGVGDQQRTNGSSNLVKSAGALSPKSDPSSDIMTGTKSDEKPDLEPSSSGSINKIKANGNSGKSDAKGSDAKPKELSDEVKKKVNDVTRLGKFAAMEARKRTIDGTKKEPSEIKEKKTKAAMVTVKDRKGRLVKVLDDDEEEMDCEFLNNRQLFLELCQTNNYQFDHMRRAKHSSMMVLWHLHNRDAPKFVQQCAICAREILSGYRYHCPTCADFDMCTECFQKPTVTRHMHTLKPIPVASGQKSEQTEEQRRERQRSIQLHMTLLLHAATCTSSKCHSQNCAKMKGLLKHGESCATKAAGGCNVCKRIWTLLQIHARQCKDSKCPVPKCLAIRERFRQIAAQQRAMDDRRRQQMNIHYRQSSS